MKRQVLTLLFYLSLSLLMSAQYGNSAELSELGEEGKVGEILINEDEGKAKPTEIEIVEIVTVTEEVVEEKPITPEPTLEPTSEPTPIEVEVKEEKLEVAKPVKQESYRVTFYDLSVASCGKSRSHAEYGLTASGKNISGLDLGDRLIAADKKHKFGTKLKLEFKGNPTVVVNGVTYELNGVYTVVDRGGSIKGDRIDIFVGEDSSGSSTIAKTVKQLGVKRATVSKVQE